MSKKLRGLLPTPNCADAFTDKLKSSQQSEDNKHSVTLGQSLNHPYFLLPTPRAREGNDGETEAGIAHGLKHGYLDATIASCSQAASPASPSVMPDESVERQTVVTSGLRLLQLSKQSSPIGCCLRTLLESSIWYSPIVKLQWQAKPLFAKYRMIKSQITTQSQEESTETSEKQGMKQFGLLYQLVVSVRPTDGTECGLLLTPSTVQIEPSEERFEKRTKYRESVGRHWVAGCLEEQIATLLPTPDASDRRSAKSKQQSMSNVIAMLPTPTKMDFKGANPNNPYDCLDSLIEVGATKDQTGKKTGMKLHSDFVSYMMGYPIDWLDME